MLGHNEMIIQNYLQSKSVVRGSSATSFISARAFHVLRVLFCTAQTLKKLV